jgi:hypothetical protein
MTHDDTTTPAAHRGDVNHRSTTMNPVRTATLAAAAIGLVLVAGTATAGQNHPTVNRSSVDNRFTWGEVNDSTFVGQAKGNVEGLNGCDCSGTLIRQWVGDDGKGRKQILYPDTDANTVYVTYVNTLSGTYRVEGVAFGTDGVAYTVKGQS